MASRRPHFTPANMQELQAQAIESTNQCELLSMEAEARIQLMEDTRDVIANLQNKREFAESLSTQFEEDESEFQEALDMVRDFEQKIDVARKVLRKQENNSKLVKIKLEEALMLANEHKHMLSEAQRFQQNQVAAKEPDWLPIRAPAAMSIPPQDLKAVQFSSQLSPENQKKFEDLRRAIFYIFCMQHVENIDVKKMDFNKVLQPMPKFRNKILYSDGRIKMEGKIASRVVMNFFAAGDFDLEDNFLKEARWLATSQINREQMEAMRRAFPRARSPKRPKLTAIIEKNVDLVKSCQPILTEFYEELKDSHLRQINCKRFMERIVAKQKTPRNVDKILTVQLNELLDNDDVSK